VSIRFDGGARLAEEEGQFEKYMYKKRALKKARGQRMVLVLPLVTILLCASFNASLNFLWNDSKPERDGSMHYWLNPRTRVNRGIRFVLFIAFMQWTAQYIFLFPNLFPYLAKERKYSLLTAMFVLLSVGLTRLGSWFTMGGGSGFHNQNRYYNFGLPHNILDSLVIILWMCWMLASLYYVTATKETLFESGYDVERFSSDDIWKSHCTLFKYMYIVPMMLYFFRGIFFAHEKKIASSIGGAQNDLIIVCLAYP
jgi:hypothetical protein